MRHLNPRSKFGDCNSFLHLRGSFGSTSGRESQGLQQSVVRASVRYVKITQTNFVFCRKYLDKYANYKKRILQAMLSAAVKFYGAQGTADIE